LTLGIELPRMLGSALYARDVLLVCQAYPDTELPELALQFRLAGAALADNSTPTGGVDSSEPASLPAVDSDTNQPAMRWLSPSRWFSR
jgi:hypothetical protein